MESFSSTYQRHRATLGVREALQLTVEECTGAPCRIELVSVDTLAVRPGLYRLTRDVSAGVTSMHGTIPELLSLSEMTFG